MGAQGSHGVVIVNTNTGVIHHPGRGDIHGIENVSRSRYTDNWELFPNNPNSKGKRR